MPPAAPAVAYTKNGAARTARPAPEGDRHGRTAAPLQVLAWRKEVQRNVDPGAALLPAQRDDEVEVRSEGALNRLSGARCTWGGNCRPKVMRFDRDGCRMSIRLGSRPLRPSSPCDLCDEPSQGRQVPSREVPARQAPAPRKLACRELGSLHRSCRTRTWRR